MPRYLKNLFVVGLTLFSMSQVFAKKRELPEQVIVTPVGNFRLTNLKIDHALGFQFIDGELLNETNKTWDDIWIAVEMTDKNGHVIVKDGLSPRIQTADPQASTGLHARNIPPGQKFKIRYQESAKADNDTLSIVFKYADGRYPVSFKTAIIKPVSSDSMAFQDDAINVTFALDKTSLEFVLLNKSDGPIKIDWNLVSFVEFDGTAQSVIHNGIKLVDRTNPKAPTMVPPRAKITDAIVPVNNIELTDNQWVTGPILPQGPVGSKLGGMEFSVYMPLDIAGTVKNYNFVFKINAAE